MILYLIICWFNLPYKVGMVFQRPTFMHFPCWRTFRSLGNFYLETVSLPEIVWTPHTHRPCAGTQSGAGIAAFSCVFWGLFAFPKSWGFIPFYMISFPVATVRFLLWCLLLLSFFSHLQRHIFSSLAHNAIFFPPIAAGVTQHRTWDFETSTSKAYLYLRTF